MLNPLDTGRIDSGNPLVRTRGVLNPYRRGAALIVKRALWDLNIESWRSRARMRDWKDRHPGKKAVILCNGPSLLKVDFSLLEGVFTFGLNKINLLFDKTDFRPSCVTAVNPFVIEQNSGFFNNTELPLFLDSIALKKVRSRSNVAFMHSSYDGFARDCSVSISQGYTVTYVAMQLAFHMGFTDVALVGCDHDFAVKGAANKTVVSGKKDESHFDPSYFAGGMRWQLPDLIESEAAYQRARAVFNAFGRRIVNCTEGGKLDVFDRLPLAEFVRN